MDFVDNALEASDALVNLTPKQKKDFKSLRGSYEKSSCHKKMNKSVVCRTHPLTSLSKRASPSIIDKRFCNYVALIQNNVIRMENDVTACLTDYCGLPYYRSCKANNSFHDNVLMKDVAVSCTLLEPKTNQDSLILSAIENYFLKQLKNEYQDLSVITKKISTYTKDKLQNLSKKYKKRKSDADLEKRPVATEYIDKNGNICLKLRLQDNESSGIKEKGAIKNIVSTLVSSWNFLFSLQQQRTENVRGKTKKTLREFPRHSCPCVHKYRKDKRISRPVEKTPKSEITHEIDTVSHIYAQKHNKYHYNHKIKPDMIIKRDKSPKSRQPIKVEKWKTECATAILNTYVPNKRMQSVNIRIIERHRRDS